MFTIISILASIFSGAGSIIGGVLGVKQSAEKQLESSMTLLKNINDNDAQATTATASALSAILSQGSYLEKIWRPILMFILMGIIFSYWFLGYMPPYFNHPMTPMMTEIFMLLKIGLGGYIPCRTIEKVATQTNIALVLKALVHKRGA